MLLGLPNTGTDWLCDQICLSNPELKYYREFFNPVCNESYAEILNQGFGCEINEDVENAIEMLAKKISFEDYQKIYNLSWAKEKFNFTKENYSAFKAEHHIKFFDCIILHREYEICFPPKRKEVLPWYQSMYFSLLYNFEDLNEEHRIKLNATKNNTKLKYKITHEIYYSILFKFAKQYSVPIIDWKNLVTKDEKDLKDEFNKFKGLLDTNNLIFRILDTRKAK
jgi:hypothetical protein